MNLNTKPQINILSSVPEGIFKNVTTGNFTEKEKTSAQKDELKVFTDCLGDLKKQVEVKIVRVMDWITPQNEADGYILWGSPSMVTDDIDWINNLIQFINKEGEKEKPILGICFGHQIVAKAFGGTVENCRSRNIGLDAISLNEKGLNNNLFQKLGNIFLSLWSHRQFVSNPGEGEVLAENIHTPNQIIQVGEKIIGTQFHPEFKPEFTTFLIKLMSADLIKEWFNTNHLIREIEQLKGINPSQEIIKNFVKKHFI